VFSLAVTLVRLDCYFVSSILLDISRFSCCAAIVAWGYSKFGSFYALSSTFGASPWRPLGNSGRNHVLPTSGDAIVASNWRF
jgi:hypothetical protein